MISRLFGALLLNVLLVTSLPAVTVGGLNSATVPVADRSAPETDRGLGEAFREVVVKLTGSRQALTQPGVRQLAGKARSFVTVLGQAAGGNASDGYRLRVDFDGDALAAALRAQGIPLWSRDRPLSAVWLAVEDADGRRYSPDAQTEAIFRALVEAAERRGLPIDLRVPTTAPPPGAAAALLETLLGPAAEGVQPATAPRLAALLKQGTDGSWTASFRWRIDADTTDWSGQGPEPIALLTEGVVRVADAVAARYTAAGEAGAEAGQVRLRIDGLHRAGDYGRVMALLRGFDIVQSLSVERASGAAVELALVVHGGQAALTQSLRLAGQFQPTPDNDTDWSLLAHD